MSASSKSPASQAAAKPAAPSTASPSRTLLVPVDGSSEASAAFDYAVKHTAKNDTLLLFHGEAQAFHLTGGGGMVVVVEQDQAASRNSNALKSTYLDRCTLLSRKCEWVTKNFVGGSSAVASDIVKTASERGAEGIVMGARGLSALGSVMLGSVSQAVLQRATMPVTVVKQPVAFNDGESWKKEQLVL